MLATAFTLIACDPIFGVVRTARLGFVPEPAKVETAIRSASGVEWVEYRFSQGDSRPLTLTGIKPAGTVHTFSYGGGSNVQGIVQFTVNYRQQVDYSQYLLRMGRRPPQSWVDATRPVMMEIEKRLEETCGLTNFRSTVVEDCVGVECK